MLNVPQLIISTFLGEKPFTKRALGVLLLVGGVVGFVAILAIDVLDVGREGGIGPAQRIALGGCVALALVGLSLLPLRDMPA